MKTSETLRSFLAIIVSVTLCLFYFTGRSQVNLIKDGQFNIDANDDGLSDSWQTGVFTTETTIEDSAQYVASFYPGSCSQALIEQVLNLTGQSGKYFTLEFDLMSDKTVYATMWTAEHSGYNLQIIEPSPYQHYSIPFLFTSEDIWGICFFTGGTAPGWIKIDNVTLTEQYPTLVTSTAISPKNGQIYEYPTGIKLDKIPLSGYYVINRKLYYSTPKN